MTMPLCNPPASIEEVISMIGRWTPPLPPERASLETSLYRVLRERVCAREDQPPFDRSAMDGYAIGIDDPAATFTVVDSIRAGEWKPRTLAHGQAVQIATGAALPGSALRVVMKEDVERTSNEIRVLRRDPKLNIRFTGEDAHKGQPLIEPGSILNPGALALLASVGCTQPLVARLPRILHVATGNEIVGPEQSPLPGQIRDSNSILVRSFLSQWHIIPEQLRLPEDESGTQSLLSTIEAPDILLISGGASVGEHDFTRHVLERLGYTIRVNKTNTRPGKPLLFATQESRLAFGLPGNPLAHFVCLNLYVRAALEGLSGRLPRPRFLPGVLAAELYNDDCPRETLWPAQVAGSEVTPLRWSSSGDLTPLARANALARIPPATGCLPSGASVQFLSTAITP